MRPQRRSRRHLDVINSTYSGFPIHYGGFPTSELHDLDYSMMQLCYERLIAFRDNYIVVGDTFSKMVIVDRDLKSVAVWVDELLAIAKQCLQNDKSLTTWSLGPQIDRFWAIWAQVYKYLHI